MKAVALTKVVVIIFMIIVAVVALSFTSKTTNIGKLPEPNCNPYNSKDKLEDCEKATGCRACNCEGPYRPRKWCLNLTEAMTEGCIRAGCSKECGAECVNDNDCGPNQYCESACFCMTELRRG